MSKVSKFMVFNNPLKSGGNTFILCTRDPVMLIKVTYNENRKLMLEVEVIYSGDPEKAEGALKRAHDWYIAFKSR